MDDKKLILSTKKSIHKPIEVEIDGKTYINNPLSRSVFDELRKYEKAALEGDIEALYVQVRLIFPVPMEILNGLDIRDINSMLEMVMARVFTEPKTDKEKAEKNVSKPGLNNSA